SRGCRCPIGRKAPDGRLRSRSVPSSGSPHPCSRPWNPCSTGFARPKGSHSRAKETDQAPSLVRPFVVPAGGATASPTFHCPHRSPLPARLPHARVRIALLTLPHPGDSLSIRKGREHGAAVHSELEDAAVARRVGVRR